ncbi:hypothetical protein M0M57_02445 [Flavobacterium azooxidireducens]|uniref:DUF2292 domain-containing protein n=1 Tax=Flavobacterium azooxidireducens TaxID=1871076 RepID=A0ABY4KJX1_9FLAO|nr:hypothetical protein [Flavobacterium azooxidireducens]UPQ79702.1 hypothetical protein M0M57_02445 [Flavobacterium azooxidireducens]
MSKKKIKESDFAFKVIKGLEIVSKKLIQTKIERNQSVIVMQNGKIVQLNAADLKKIVN